MSNIGNQFGAQDFKAVTRAMDLNRNNILDGNEATFSYRANRTIGNGNGVNGTRETSDAMKRGDLFVRGMKPQAAEALATYFSRRAINEGKMPDQWIGDATISRDDLRLSPEALRRVDRNQDGRISRREFSDALVSGDLTIGIDSQIDDRPVPPAVDRPVPPPVAPRNQALDTLDFAAQLASQGYTSRANEAFSEAIHETVVSDEALTIARRAASLGYTSRANEAYSRASNVARSSSEALMLAQDAASNGYTSRANDAFSRASSLTRYSDEALEVARSAASLGYTSRANEAFSRATNLCQSRDEARRVASDANALGYTSRANEAMQRAIYLP